MGFWTDWYDYPEDGEFNKLAGFIKQDAKLATSRPSATDLSLMLSRLADVYSQEKGSDLQTLNNIRNILIELGNAAKTNHAYKEALFNIGAGDNVFAKYCALFMLVHPKDASNLKSLDDLCKKFSPNLKFADVISAQTIFIRKRDANLMQAAAVLKQVRSERQ